VRGGWQTDEICLSGDVSSSRMTGRAPALRTVLLSGGIDSTCLLALCAEQQKGEVDALFVDYGQPVAHSESTAAAAVAQAFGAELRRARLAIGPVGQGEIPARNALLLHVALATAPSRPATVMIGIHAGTPYLDCTPGFLHAMRVSFDFHRAGTLQLAAPFLTWSKTDVYAYARAMSIPFELTHSCEAATEPCGACPSCVDRKLLNAC